MVTVQRLDINDHLTWAQHGPALEKMAALLQSAVLDPQTQSFDRWAWGVPVHDIGAFLRVVADLLRDQGERIEERREKKEQCEAEKDESPDTRWEIKVLNEFYGVAAMTGPIDRNYGRDRRLLRIFDRRNPDVTAENLLELIPVFFAESTHAAIRRDGSFPQFLREINALGRLHAQRSEVAPPEDFIPKSVVVHV